MTVPTSTELGLLHTRPQNTKLYLSLYKPTPIFSCRINNAGAAKGDRVVTYDNASGTYTNIEYGMVAIVGTTHGGEDKGRIRVRSATSSELTLAENSHINWANDDYVMVLNFFEIMAVYPRITDPAGDGNTVWYKDYDIPYTGQNDRLGCFVNMGSHYAGFVNEPVYYTAAGTYDMLGAALTYCWKFTGTVTAYTGITPGYVTYTTPGHYTTALIVSGSLGGVDTSYRHVSIYNRPGQGSNVPILKWEMNGLSGSRTEGGYSTRVKIFEDVPRGTIRDGTLAVIFADDWYGDTKQSIGGNATNRSSIVFVGYIVNDSIQYNYADSYVEFELTSPTGIMKNVEGFSVGVNSAEDPTNDAYDSADIPTPWVLVHDMDIRRGLYHFLKWHTTVLLCADLEFRGTDKYVKYFDVDRTSLYDAVQSWVNGTLIGDVVSDRQGKIWAEVSIEATDLASGSFPTTLNMSKMDWMNEPNITEQSYQPLSMLELGGFIYVPGGITGSSTPLLSQAPGVAPAYEGGIERIEGLVITDQVDLNKLSGNIFAAKNARYPMVDVEVAGNYRTLDIAPQEMVSLNIASTDTKRGITFSEKPFAVKGLFFSYVSEQEALTLKLSVSEVTQGFPGDTIVIPQEPPGEDGGGGEGPKIIINPPTGTSITIVTGSTAHPNLAYAIGYKYIVPSASFLLILAKTTNFNASGTAIHWADYWSTRQEPNVAVNGTFLRYEPFYTDPWRGGYMLTTTGLWKITGLDDPSPGTVIAYQILDVNDILSYFVGMPISFGIYCTGIFSITSFTVGINNKISLSVTVMDGIFHKAVGILTSTNDGGSWTGAEVPYNIYYDLGGQGGSSIKASTQNSTNVFVADGRGTMVRQPIIPNYPSDAAYIGDCGNYYASEHVCITEKDTYLFSADVEQVLRITSPCTVVPGNNYVDVSPVVGGLSLGGLRSGKRYGGLVCSRINSTHLAACLIHDPSNGYADLYTTADSGGTWTLVKDVTSANQISLVMHPYDPSKLYLYDPQGTGKFDASSDGGVTWENKNGDWHTEFGCNPGGEPESGAPRYAEIFPIFDKKST